MDDFYDPFDYDPYEKCDYCNEEFHINELIYFNLIGIIHYNIKFCNNCKYKHKYEDIIYFYHSKSESKYYLIFRVKNKITNEIKILDSYRSSLKYIKHLEFNNENLITSPLEWNIGLSIIKSNYNEKTYCCMEIHDGSSDVDEPTFFDNLYGLKRYLINKINQHVDDYLEFFMHTDFIEIPINYFNLCFDKFKTKQNKEKLKLCNKCNNKYFDNIYNNKKFIHDHQISYINQIYLNWDPNVHNKFSIRFKDSILELLKCFNKIKKIPKTIVHLIITNIQYMLNELYIKGDYTNSM